METFETSEELIKECIRDLYLEPRNLILKWSKITNQTSQGEVSISRTTFSFCHYWN